MANNKIYFKKGTAFKLIDGQPQNVDSIADQSPCDCELDCCLQAIKLKDHGTNDVKYIYILNGVLTVGTLTELKEDSTII